MKMATAVMAYMEKSGYDVRADVLDAQDYGAPQRESVS